jgi:hypothetical protein
MFAGYPQGRKIVYIVSAVVALLLGATQAYFAATGANQPQWLIGVLAVLAFIQTFINGLAASNTPAAPAGGGPGPGPAGTK